MIDPATMRVGVPRYAGDGWYYVKVWMSTPGNPLNRAVRGPFPTVEACRADLRAIS